MRYVITRALTNRYTGHCSRERHHKKGWVVVKNHLREREEYWAGRPRRKLRHKAAADDAACLGVGARVMVEHHSQLGSHHYIRRYRPFLLFPKEYTIIAQFVFLYLFLHSNVYFDIQSCLIFMRTIARKRLVLFY